MTYPQYGVYLVPPPALLYPLSLAHQVVAAEFGATTAGKFMVHCTVKGFTKLAEGATPADFVPALDEYFARTPAFETEVKQVYRHGSTGHSNSIVLLLDRTAAFHQFHREVWEIVRPFIAPDCRFSNSDWAGDFFVPHITLAMSDLPEDPALLEQLGALGDYVLETLPRGSFLARDMQLVEFYSEDWNGAWWDTLAYKQLKGWRLKSQ